MKNKELPGVGSPRKPKGNVRVKLDSFVYKYTTFPTFLIRYIVFFLYLSIYLSIYTYYLNTYLINTHKRFTHVVFYFLLRKTDNFVYRKYMGVF